jgi:D-alanyl-lipoteichoic acid acyltransferase DltB (MBOAT superfamily)
MTICGLWHGPAWNFCLWGLLHGFALVLNHLYSDTKNSMNLENRELVFVRNGFSWIATQIFVGLAWIPFFYPLKETLTIFSKLGVWL